MNNKIIIVIFLFIIAIILIIEVLQTEKDKVILTKQPQTIEEFNIIHKEDDDIKWDLTSKRAIIGENETTIVLNETITINIHSDDKIVVRAGSGIINRTKETVTMKDNVVISMKDFTLTTNSLTWSGGDNIIYTPDDIELKGDNITVTGNGLVAQVKDKTVTIKKNVKAQLYN
jgi:LPS export ABC transporter protein LptC